MDYFSPRRVLVRLFVYVYIMALLFWFGMRVSQTRSPPRGG